MDGRFDLVVVGAGHAGCEAALAAARMGCRVAVLTLLRGRFAEIPCNPAVGGIGKGHLVVEVDALGGVQGWAADRAGIQFKLLNRSRGPAVQGPRVQCDKLRYSLLMRRLLERVPGVVLVEDEVVGLLPADGGVAGVATASGRRLLARAVVLTTGTFLRGLLHTGAEQWAGGRLGEPPARNLSGELERWGLELRRYKTGTPPRVWRDSLCYRRMEVQEGDEVPRPFSWRTRAVCNRARCWVTRTPAVVGRIIRDNLHRSPLFAGVIEGTGPRYCPSIEDKVVRFPHHEEHTLFIEPETLDGESMYINGLSTSLPADVQEAMLREIPGLEHARILRHGYAVEYDVLAPGQLRPTLEVKEIPGLWVAGQVVGSSGYEEAAAQGLVAGINAALRLRGEPPWVPAREEGYIGVLVDDLVQRDHTEPYRMFTSRAEHRLLLGVHSARERLMPTGYRLGLVPERVFHVEHSRWERRREALERLETERLAPAGELGERVEATLGVSLRRPCTWGDLVRRQDVDPGAVAREAPALAGLAGEDLEAVLYTARYAGYLARARREVERVKRLAHLEIPEDVLSSTLPRLSREVREQLERHRPRTLAEAERVPGVTPAALAVLAGVLGRGRREAG